MGDLEMRDVARWQNHPTCWRGPMAQQRGFPRRCSKDPQRSRCDSETVRRDLPALTIRVPELLEGREQPWRIVCTNHPKTLPSDAPLFCDDAKHRTLVKSPSSLETMLRELVREQGVLSVMIEAGGKFSAAMLREGLVDEAIIYYAPILCGETVPALAGEAFPYSMKMNDIHWEKCGVDLKFRGLLEK